MKLDILAFGAHPDDVELAASGTIAQHVSQGLKCGIIDLTKGELGTRGSVALREEEASLAANILGLSVRENLGMPDGFITNDSDHLMAVIKKIRKYQPDIVLCNAISDRHTDHGRAAILVAEACFLSGLVKIETGSYPAWRPKVVYHYIQDYYIKPDVIIDITNTFDTKMKSIKAYASQFHSEGSKEPETPISRQDFLPFIEARAREMGRLIGCTYGEGFTVRRPVGAALLTTLI